MKRLTLKTLGLPTALVLALALATSATAQEQKKPAQTNQASQTGHMDHAGQSMSGHSEGSKELHEIMMEGRKMPMNMTGDVDKDFAGMMAMHHQQAIKMSDVLLQNGKDAELKALARKMKESQQEELKTLIPHSK